MYYTLRANVTFSTEYEEMVENMNTLQNASEQNSA